MRKSNGKSLSGRKRNVIERKQKGDLVWWEDESTYKVCSWCPNKDEVEKHVKHLELYLQIRSVVNGIDRPYKHVSHIICKDHIEELLKEYKLDDK